MKNNKSNTYTLKPGMHAAIHMTYENFTVPLQKLKNQFGYELQKDKWF